jgi:hypothetical protein
MKAPSKEGLAEELLGLAKQFKKEHLSWWLTGQLPWPLAVCISEAASGTDLNALSERVLSGAFGSTDEWSACEDRWTSRGLTSEDIERALRSGQKLFEFPWTAFDSSIDEMSPGDAHALDTAIEDLAQIYQSAGGASPKAWLARLIVSCLEVGSSSWECPRRTSCYLNPSLLAELVNTTRTVTDVVDLMLSLRVPEPLSEDWIEMFDQIGTRDITLFASPVFAESTLARAIAEAYLRHPNRTGLMAWLEAASSFKELVAIPSERLSFSEDDNLQVQKRKLVLRLAQGQPAGGDFSLMVNKAAEVLKRPAGGSAWHVIAILQKFRGEDWVGRFTIELMAKLNSVGAKSLAEECLHSLVEWLGFRKSPLHDTNAVGRLGLEGLNAE